MCGAGTLARCFCGAASKRARVPAPHKRPELRPLWEQSAEASFDRWIRTDRRELRTCLRLSEVVDPLSTKGWENSGRRKREGGRRSARYPDYTNAGPQSSIVVQPFAPTESEVRGPAWKES